eukprot:GILI01016195.1.p1 GENE.GILI01016195.1~~GILI01016195.1.p1  ORF type:complete len:226 (-),score=40.38 GILI01016195.1:191-868(-)
MFRRSVIGFALAAAMEDLSAPPHKFTMSEATKGAIWDDFEKILAEGLRSVPATHKATIVPSSSTAPEALNADQRNRFRALSFTDTTAEVPKTNAVNATSSADLLTSIPAAMDPSAQFPMYRYVDGRWTILMKDVEVKINVPVGTSVKASGGRTKKSGLDDISVHCDYLEIAADGELHKAQKEEEVAKRLDALERLHKSLPNATTVKAERGKAKTAKRSAPKRGRE